MLQVAESELRRPIRVPVCAEVIYALDMRNQGSGYLNVLEMRPTFPVPETQEQFDDADKYTETLKGFLGNDVLGYEMAGSFIMQADSLVARGKISQKQYLSIHDTYLHVALGDAYQALEAPPEYIARYGSIHETV